MADNSVITIHRRELLTQITSGGSSSMPHIIMIAFGDGGTDNAGNPIPPLETATALLHQLALYEIDSVEYPAPTTARYIATIPPDDLSGAIINEAALVDTAGGIHAIRTMYDKRKDGGVSFTFTFDDEF